MGCDIHTFVEVRAYGKWVPIVMNPPLWDWRSYGLFGFLADVRNYSKVPPQFANRGWPKDHAEWVSDYGFDESEDDYYHSRSWCSLEELLNFNYDATFEDRRCSETAHFPGGGSYTDGAALASPGKGQVVTFREFLLSLYFSEIERLKALGKPQDVRVLFAFDN